MKKLLFCLIALSTFIVMACQQPEEEQYLSVTINNFPENVDYISFSDGKHWSNMITSNGTYKLIDFVENTDASIIVYYKHVNLADNDWNLFYYEYANLITDTEQFQVYLENNEIENTAPRATILNDYDSSDRLETNIISYFNGTFKTSNEMTFTFKNKPRKIATTEIRLSEQNEQRYYYIDTSEITEKFYDNIYEYDQIEGQRGKQIPQIQSTGLYYVDKYSPELTISFSPKHDYEVISDVFSITDPSSGEFKQSTYNKLTYSFTPAKTKGIAAQGGVIVKITGGDTQLIDDKNFVNKTLTMVSVKKNKDNCPDITEFELKFFDTRSEPDLDRDLELKYNGEVYTGDWYLTKSTQGSYRINFYGASYGFFITLDNNNEYTLNFAPIDLRDTDDYYNFSYTITLTEKE